MIATFTLAWRDPNTETLGIVTASNFLAVGSLVPWISTPHGLVVSQSFAHPDRARAALAKLAAGGSATAARDCFLSDDPRAAERQLGILPLHGPGLVYSGPNCVDTVEHLVEENFMVCGNMLKPGTIAAMAKTFRQQNVAEDPGAAMLEALQAGQDAGGDKRGKLAAAMLIKRPGAGYQGSSDTWVDLRVDAHPQPIERLTDLYTLFQLYAGPHADEEWLPLATLSTEQQQQLAHLSAFAAHHCPWHHQPQALADLLAQHNLGAHIQPAQGAISRQLLHQAQVLPRLLGAQS